MEFRWLGKVTEGIKAQLDRTVLKCSLGRWNETVQGVLLSYHALKVRDPAIKVMGDIAAFRVPIRYSGVFFAPKPGDVLSKHYSGVKILKAGNEQLRGKACGLFPVNFPSEGSSDSPLSLNSGTYTWKQSRKEVLKGEEVQAEVLE